MRHLIAAIDRHLRRRHARPSVTRRPGASRGFTIAEMLAVLAMIAVLTVAASPVFINMMRDRRINSAALQVVDMYRTARMRALGRGVPVRISWDESDGHKNGSSGVLTIRERVVSTVESPNQSISCSDEGWNKTDQVYDYMRFDFGDGRHERAVLSFFDADNKRQTRTEICFSPRGRAFLRAGDTFTELAGVPRFTVANSGTGLQRTVFLPPNGVARLAQ